MKKILEILLAVVIIAALIFFLWFLLRPKSTTNTKEPTPNANLTPGTTETGVPVVSSDSIPSNGEVSATAVARSFVERFGSYSSETNYANVDDVKPLATVAFAAKLDQLAATARKNATDGYYGISTLTLSTSIIKDADAAKTMTVTTQREEASGSPENTNVFVQDISVSMVKEGDKWLVDGFTWGDVKTL